MQEPRNAQLHFVVAKLGAHELDCFFIMAVSSLDKFNNLRFFFALCCLGKIPGEFLHRGGREDETDARAEHQTHWLGASNEWMMEPR